MDPKIIEYLQTERMSVLSVALLDGTPHAAAMHFVFSDGVIYFSTHANSKKVVSNVLASVVIGFSETDWITLQMSGKIEKTEPVKDLILSKYPESIKFIDESTVYLKFTPTWYRYSDFKVVPPLIIEK